jgi:hypothetical protein
LACLFLSFGVCVSTFGQAYTLLEKLQKVQQEINAAAPSSPSHALLLEMGLIQHGTPQDLERYYASAPRAYMENPLASELRAQFLAMCNRADLYPVFKAFDGPLYKEQVCLIPWGPSVLRKEALLEVPDASSLMGYGTEKKGLSRVTVAMAWADVPTAEALASSPVFPGETPASPPQAMLVGALVALCRLSLNKSGRSQEEQEKLQWQALAVLEQAQRHGAVLDEPCPEIVPMLEFMDEGGDVNLRPNPVGRHRGYSPDYVHPPAKPYDSRPKHLTPAYIARQAVRDSMYENELMSAEVFEALVQQLGKSTVGRKVLTEVACDRFTERFGKAMEGVDLLLEDEADEVWNPGRWTLHQSWAPDLPLSAMMLYKSQQHQIATNEELERWIDGLAAEFKGAISGPAKQKAFEKISVLEKHLAVWVSPEQQEFLNWSFRSFREALEQGHGNGTEQDVKAFALKLTGVKEFAWTRVRRGEESSQPQRRSGPRL